jgi:acetoacetate decarboxylase
MRGRYATGGREILKGFTAPRSPLGAAALREHDKPAVDEARSMRLGPPLITNIWIGEGELSFAEAYGEELELLGPLNVGRGYRFSFSYSVTDIDILADLTA